VRKHTATESGAHRRGRPKRGTPSAKARVRRHRHPDTAPIDQCISLLKCACLTPRRHRPRIREVLMAHRSTLRQDGDVPQRSRGSGVGDPEPRRREMRTVRLAALFPGVKDKTFRAALRAGRARLGCRTASATFNCCSTPTASSMCSRGLTSAEVSQSRFCQRAAIWMHHTWYRCREGSPPSSPPDISTPCCRRGRTFSIRTHRTEIAREQSPRFEGLKVGRSCRARRLKTTSGPSRRGSDPKVCGEGELRRW
jgi:hypothetical protein